MSGSTTAAGSKLAICAALPATENAAGYAALTYVNVSRIEKWGGIGASFAKVDFKPLDGPVEKHKGSVDYGSITPSLAVDRGDAGQALLRTAARDKLNLYTFRVTYPTGELRYFQGRVMGMPENVEGADSILMASPAIEICTEIVEVEAPAAGG